MLTVHMQARGFTPGEKIEVILDVNNQSSQDVAYFSIGLFKVSKPIVQVVKKKLFVVTDGFL